MKYIPQRMCIICRKRKNKEKLIRVVKNQEEIVIDLAGKINSRGAYICDNIACVEKAIKTRKMEKILKASVKEDFYENLKQKCLERKIRG